MSESPIFVAGATGFLGRSVLAAAIAHDFEVRALVRTPAQQALVSSLGAKPIVGDLLRPRTLEGALRGCGVALHLAQASEGSLEELRRVRVEGGSNLVRAATQAKVPRFLVGSGYWVYASNPGTLVEDSPLEPLHLSQVNLETEEVAREAERKGDLSAVVVARPGMVYGNGSWLRSWVEELRAGTYRYIEDGSNFMSPVHWQDAGEGLLRIALRGTKGSSYLVVDDDPVPVRDFATFVATHLGSGPPRSIPFKEAAREWGPDLARLNAASRRASNGALTALGWRPRYPSYRQGLPKVLLSFRGRRQGSATGGSVSPARPRRT